MQHGVCVVSMGFSLPSNNAQKSHPQTENTPQAQCSASDGLQLIICGDPFRHFILGEVFFSKLLMVQKSHSQPPGIYKTL